MPDHIELLTYLAPNSKTSGKSKENLVSSPPNSVFRAEQPTKVKKKNPLRRADHEYFSSHREPPRGVLHNPGKLRLPSKSGQGSTSPPKNPTNKIGRTAKKTAQNMQKIHSVSPLQKNHGGLIRDPTGP